MQNKKEYTVAVVYSDAGPKGRCGQSCSTTMPWTKVWMFKNEKDAEVFIKSNPFPQRKMSRISICSIDPKDPNTLEYL